MHAEISVFQAVQRVQPSGATAHQRAHGRKAPPHALGCMQAASTSKQTHVGASVIAAVHAFMTGAHVEHCHIPCIKQPRTSDHMRASEQHMICPGELAEAAHLGWNISSWYVP